VLYWSLNQRRVIPEEEDTMVFKVHALFEIALGGWLLSSPLVLKEKKVA
jgi:hypothetical protein